MTKNLSPLELTHIKELIAKPFKYLNPSSIFYEKRWVTKLIVSGLWLKKSNSVLGSIKPVCGFFLVACISSGNFMESLSGKTGTDTVSKS